MDRSRKMLFSSKDVIDLEKVLLHYASDLTGHFKCRLIYALDIEEIEFIPYSIPAINSLKVVYADQIEYNHKYLDRRQLDQLFGQREDCDDVLIIKNGLVTDSSYANVLLHDGDKWLTPDKPLLEGTQRMSLLKKRAIHPRRIKVEDLKAFAKVRLINAMIRFEDQLDIAIENISI